MGEMLEMKYRRGVFGGLLCIAIALLVGGMAFAQIIPPPTYPGYRGKISDWPVWVSLANTYVQCRVGIQGTLEVHAECNDSDDSGGSTFRGDKNPPSDPNAYRDWGVSGRYGIVSLAGDPEITEDDNRPITFMGHLPCHYFGYWKLRIGNDMRMIGDGASGGWYRENQYSPVMSPSLIDRPPEDMASTGPFLRSVWRTSGGNGSTILTEIRIHLVRDLARFEYRITNTGTVAENIGLCQNGDVEVGDPVYSTAGISGYYGPYDNANYAFLIGKGAAQPVRKQQAMKFGGYETVKGKQVARPAVPDWFEVYDDVQSPVNVTRNVLGLEDATKPDYVAIGDYNDLFHKEMWPPTDYKPDMAHTILDMCWVLCWNQKLLAPGATRTLVTYYGMGSATSRWTYLIGKTPARDSAVLAMQTPRSVKYDSTSNLPSQPEFAPSMFSVKAWIYNLATNTGPRDVTASIFLPPGLELVPGVADNVPRKEIGMVDVNSESDPVVWTVMPTGDYCGELPIYVSVVDNDPSGTHWQQTVVRKVFVPAVKRGLFAYGWQLMSVPFAFNNPTLSYVFGLTPGTYSAKYWNGTANVNLSQLTPGRGFWMYIISGPTWQHPQPFYLVSDAAIVGEAIGTGKQVQEQEIKLAKGWNMIGNPFVYPMYWRQVLVWYGTPLRLTLDEAVAKGWLDSTLFAWNTDKWDYDILRDSSTMLNAWKGYWVYARYPVTLIFRPPVMPSSDVTANPGGR